MNVSDAESLLTELERQPERAQLHHGEIEGIIAFCMDEVHELAKTGADDKRKMRLVAIEHRARFRREKHYFAMCITSSLSETTLPALWRQAFSRTPEAVSDCASRQMRECLPH